MRALVVMAAAFLSVLLMGSAGHAATQSRYPADECAATWASMASPFGDGC